MNPTKIDKVFNALEKKRSLKRDNNEKDFKCHSCGKSFSQAGNLKRHKHTVHESLKDYKCESCGKSFSQEMNLKRHVYTVHEGHKDHKCEF